MRTAVVRMAWLLAAAAPVALGACGSSSGGGADSGNTPDGTQQAETTEGVGPEGDQEATDVAQRADAMLSDRVGADTRAEDGIDADVPGIPRPDAPLTPTLLASDLPASLESLAFDGKGFLFGGTSDGRVVRVAPDGTSTVYADLLPVDAGVNPGTAGVTFGPDGSLYVCRFDASRIERVSMEDPSDVTVWRDDIETPNTILFRDGDTLWYTSSGGHSGWKGHVGRIRSGQAPEVMVPNVTYANGLAFSPDGTTLYVTSSQPGSVLRAAVLPDGSVEKPEVVADGPDFTVADGLAVAWDGTVLVAGFGAGKIMALQGDVSWTLAADPAGALLGVATLAFGAGPGFDASRVYATNLLKPVVLQVGLPL